MRGLRLGHVPTPHTTPLDFLATTAAVKRPHHIKWRRCKATLLGVHLRSHTAAVSYARKAALLGIQTATILRNSDPKRTLHFTTTLSSLLTSIPLLCCCYNVSDDENGSLSRPIYWGHPLFCHQKAIVQWKHAIDPTHESGIRNKKDNRVNALKMLGVANHSQDSVHAPKVTLLS